MDYLLNPSRVFGDPIIDGLKSAGINRRKAEDKLFTLYSYLIQVGETKYALSKEDLFDAYSDTILAVIHSVSQGYFKNRSSLKTFVCEIYHNKCIDLIRKKSTRKNAIYKTDSINEMQSSLSDNSITVIEKLIRQSDMEVIKKEMSNLSEKNQQLLLLSADGYTDKEIAAMTKLKTADVVKTCRLRCLKKLRQQLCKVVV